ncbi:helix-turn-helix transcriptional regulator [Gordonibacter sp. An230]|uniref:helix-turn-helix transcriptional regulator n=1 Tax=Gordonibacter sp. An230 TaxID=1965592 RepID=UPI0013A66FCF|nr:helix-turn-helix transcriptional regulator [Gordonibacter sp. An230]
MKDSRVQGSRQLAATSIGAGVYWASILLQVFYHTGSASVDAAGSSLLGNARMDNLAFILLICLSLTLLTTRFGTMRFCRVLVSAAFFASVTMLLVSLASAFVDSEFSTWVSPVLRILRSACFALLMLSWGYVFARLNKYNAFISVTLTMLVAAFVFLLCSVCFQPIERLLDQVLLPISAFLQLGLFKHEEEDRLVSGAVSGDRKRVAVSFVGSRIVFGLIVGILSAIGDIRVRTESFDEDFSQVVALVLAVVVLIALLVQWKTGKLTGYLPVLIFVIAGVIAAPCLMSKQSLFALLGQVVWLSWIVMSSVQLSEMKERLGVGAAFLSFAEKTVVILFWLIGVAFGQLFYDSIFADNAALADYVQYGLALIALSYFSISLQRMLSIRDFEKIVHEVVSDSEETLAYIYDRIAEDFQLTHREREVLSLLAQGHTRRIICERLVISDGTAKSHIGHIYEKVGVNKKDGLLELVERYKREPMRQMSGK